MNTACSKCSNPLDESRFNMVRFGMALTTAYRCKQCGHWNDLKRRKGWAAYKQSMEERKG